MEKTEFLEKISSMTREEIQEKMNADNKHTRRKLICPVVYLKKKSIIKGEDNSI